MVDGLLGILAAGALVLFVLAVVQHLRGTEEDAQRTLGMAAVCSLTITLVALVRGLNQFTRWLL